MALKDVPIDQIDITSPFWKHVQDRSRVNTIPAVIEAQKSWNHWTCLTWKEGNDIKPHQFWDSDIYKVVEAACYFLIKHPDKTMRATVEEAVDMIRGAQYEDGYINSFYTVRGIDQRWTNLRDDHELYCMGHLLEATVAYETLTGNGRLLEVANKVCKHLDSIFGIEPGKKRGYPGHQEVEIGLLRLYEMTKDPLPLKLARYFIAERGQRDEKDEIYFDKEAIARGGDPYKDMGTEHKAWYPEPRDYGYHQADRPLVDANEVKGHSVRAMYFYTAATDLVRLSQEIEEDTSAIQAALGRLWRDMVDKKIYVTGAIGSVRQWEGFGQPYSLPDLEHEGCYAETCATFALINWCNRLLRLDLDSQYADIMEIALYNGFLGAVSQDGDAFYYQNVLRTRRGEPKERSKWFGVACCPPNVAKLLGNLGSLIYSHDAASKTVAIHQYIGSDLNIPDTGVSVSQKSNMPWDGIISIRVEGSTNLALRIPSWAKKWGCSLTGRMEKGYFLCFAADVVVTLNLSLEFRQVYGHPAIGERKMCFMRGPLVYCLEDVDNKGVDVDRVGFVDEPVGDGSMISVCGVDGVITGRARGRQLDMGMHHGLYSDVASTYEDHKRALVFIPYFLRSNRGGNGAMRVWASCL